MPLLPSPVWLGRRQVGTFRRWPAVFLCDVIGRDEELEFHLLELTSSEGIVARINLIAEGLANLRNAVGHLLPGDLEDISKLRDNGLRCFRTQVGHIVRALNRT